MADLVRDDGRFAPPEALAERLREAGVEEDTAVGAYCGSGVTAAHTALAMAVAGRPIPAVYVGSWSNWVADPNRPVATDD
jgi:thiosulfate/3-mercaptopyruvate sulfurtransferase